MKLTIYSCVFSLLALLETTASNMEVAEGDDPYDCDQ